jgi:hypothetical protein
LTARYEYDREGGDWDLDEWEKVSSPPIRRSVHACSEAKQTMRAFADKAFWEWKSQGGGYYITVDSGCENIIFYEGGRNIYDIKGSGKIKLKQLRNRQ